MWLSSEAKNQPEGERVSQVGRADCLDPVDYQTLFESSPSLCLVLRPDLTIVNASDAYLKATMTERQNIIGEYTFTVFPDNPADPSASGVATLKASLHRVLKTRVEDVLSIQKYDIRRPEIEGGGFEERHWIPVNSPILGPNGEVAYIIHRVTDVTELVRLKKHEHDRCRENDELRDHNERMEAEIFRRAQQLQEISERERRSREHTHQELSRVRAAAAEERERFRVAFAEASVGMALFDAEGCFLDHNKAFTKITGYSEDDLRARDILSITHPDDRARNAVLTEKMLAGEIPAFVIEKRYIKKDGGTVWVQNSVSVARYATDAPPNIIAIAEDISERKRAEEERRELLAREQAARAEAERANRAKDEFLAMLGHELRNPLAPIVTALHLMQLRGEQATARERSIIERQVAHVVRLVDDLLDVSRITRAKIELNEELVLLSDVIAKAIEMSSPLVEQRRHVLEVSIPNRELTMRGDRVRLAQILSNLLTNAAKYTEPGGKIFLSAAQEGEDVSLRVRDTGIGITAELTPHIFDVFVQERQSLERSQGGLGLGLAIVRSLVTLHGGTVEVHSGGLGKGSEFVVRFPFRPPPEHAGPPVGELDPTRTSVLPVQRRPWRILVVDDNVDAAALLTDALVALGHIAKIAHDGPSALDIAATFRPDVALLDIGLPLMDGYEVARRLRELPGLAATRLVAVTGYGQASDRHRSKSAGFDDHFVKPIDIGIISSLLAHATQIAARPDGAHTGEEPTPAHAASEGERATSLLPRSPPDVDGRPM